MVLQMQLFDSLHPQTKPISVELERERDRERERDGGRERKRENIQFYLVLIQKTN